jgi:hypothetical protein
MTHSVGTLAKKLQIVVKYFYRNILRQDDLIVFTQYGLNSNYFWTFCPYVGKDYYRACHEAK